MQEQKSKKTYHYLIHNNGKSTTAVYMDKLNQADQAFLFYQKQPLHQEEQNKSSLFVDNQFVISKADIRELQGQFGEQIILKRLCRLYPQKHMPPLFSPNPPKTVLPNTSSLPHCIYQISMLDSSAFRKKIINSQISQNGRYEILANFDGKYQLEVVDDIIPVFKSNEQCIWGSYLPQPWQVVLIKMWAKINKGYSNLKISAAFAFLQCFWQSDWKRFNLSVDGKYFTNYYKDKLNHCKIILKSKQSQINENSGLISGRIAYQLVGMEEGKNQHSIMMIETKFKNAWTGKNSIFDKQMTLTDKIKDKFKLNRSLLLTQKDFLNIFSYAYVTHARLSLPILRSFHQYSNASLTKKAKYFKMVFQTEGFLSFSIRQPQSNISNQEGSQQQRDPEPRRLYLPLKFILSRKIEASQQVEAEQSEIQVSRIRSLIRESQKKFKEKYNELEYEIFEMANTLGFSKPDAHFIKVVPGTYILRTKCSASPNQSDFVISYSTHEFVHIDDITMSAKEDSSFLEHSLISLADRLPAQTFSKEEFQKLTMADYTNFIGYGFAVIKVDRKCPYRVRLQTDPKVLFQQGYVLKKQFKKSEDKFQIELKGGHSRAIIFKRRKDAAKYVWPSKAFKVQKIKN